MKNSQCIVLALACAALLATGCQSPNMRTDRPSTSPLPNPVSEAGPATGSDPGPAIRAALDQQMRAWNAGDLSAFMSIYARSDQTRFASGGEVSMGWQTVYDRYQKRYGTGASMGALTFSDIQITETGKDSALAFGHWQLRRNTEISSGLFTLLFRQTTDGWRIVHDHTSSAAKP